MNKKFFRFYRNHDAGAAGGGNGAVASTFGDIDEDDNTDNDDPRNPGSQSDDPPADPSGKQTLEDIEGDALTEFLKDHGITDGRLAYGSEDNIVNFSELPEKDKLNVLRQLNAEAKAAGTPQFEGENKAFLDMLAMGRTPKDIARQLLANETDFTKLDDDEVNRADIKRRYPKWTEETIEKELEDRKRSATYDKKTETLREQLIAENESVNGNAMLEATRVQLQQEVDAEREELVQVAASIDNIFGFDITDAHRNAFLRPLVEVDQNFQSEFIKALQDPKEMFLYQASRAMLPGVIEYYEKELKDQEKKIRDEYMGTMPTKPITGNTLSPEEKGKKAPAQPQQQQQPTRSQMTTGGGADSDEDDEDVDWNK